MISHKRVYGMVLQGKSFSSHVTPTAPQHNQTFKQIQISVCLGRFIIKPNPGSEDVLAKRIERLLIYVGKIWRIYVEMDSESTRPRKEEQNYRSDRIYQ